MKKSLLAYLLAAGLTTASLQAEEPFPIKFIALGGGTQHIPSPENSDDYDRPFGVLAENSASDKSACACVPEYRQARQLCVPTHYAEASGLLMHRVTNGRVLITEDGASVLDSSNLDDLTGGFQTTLGWQLFGSAHHAVELTYFGLYGWDQSESFTDLTNGLAVPGLAGILSPNFDDASQVNVQYNSDLYNAEFNYVRSFYHRGAKIDFLSGFRYIHLDESLAIQSDDTRTVFGFPLAPGIGTYAVDVRNNLFGHQIGGRYSRPLGRWSLQTVGKAGVFLNDASTSQRLGNTLIATPISSASEDDRSVAAMGEIGIFGRRQLTDTWAFKLGYQATGVGGVALATNQATPFEPETSSGVRADSFFFMHGGIFGLEAAW
jgi:hypothetical protein